MGKLGGARAGCFVLVCRRHGLLSRVSGGASGQTSLLQTCLTTFSLSAKSVGPGKTRTNSMLTVTDTSLLSFTTIAAMSAVMCGIYAAAWSQHLRRTLDLTLTWPDPDFSLHPDDARGLSFLTGNCASLCRRR